jgi:hypothetical protein
MIEAWKRGRQWALAGVVLCNLLAGCEEQPSASGQEAQVGFQDDAIVDVANSSVERQSIGNCWIYAHASWIEAMHLQVAGEQVDLSQSYWTYWHWFDQITGSLARRDGSASVSTGGSWSTANGIVKRYGMLSEEAFVPEDGALEISWRQSDALARINASLSTGALSTRAARADRALVRRELDHAWGLSASVVAMLDGVFGADVARTFSGRGDARAVVGESALLDPATYPVAYAKRTVSRRTERVDIVQSTVSRAMTDWRTAYYWPEDRATLQRAQRALHARQPAILTWDVDFNAMESNPTSELRGSFNLATLQSHGAPGSQGGHMVVLEDYEVDTTDYGRLLAGQTLDPTLSDDAAKLAAALRDDSQVRFWRVKNSWGTARPDRGSAPGFPGYHDLYMDYLNGPIAWCPDADRSAPDFKCTQTTVPLQSFVLPPGF